MRVQDLPDVSTGPSSVVVLRDGCAIATSSTITRTWQRGEAVVDVTEIFKQAPVEKRRRAWRLALYLLSFVFIIYRLVEASVSALLTPDGRETAHRLLQDAAASFCGGRGWGWLSGGGWWCPGVGWRH